LFSGTYDDISPDWYLEIGVIIILTLALNVLVSIFDIMLVALLRYLRRCIDQRCGKVKTSQKTKK
jgi:hypothetical protein